MGFEPLLLWFGGLLAMAAAPPAFGASHGGPIVLETRSLEEGEAFSCRIPVQVRYRGATPLRSIRVIARVYDGDAELSSTGISTGRPMIPRYLPNGEVRYAPVPMQFDLSSDDCTRIDALVIEFAACTFGQGPAENCLERIRFAGSSPQRPHHLPVRAIPSD